MTGSAAIRKGIKEGLDDAKVSSFMSQIVEKLGGDPSMLVARVEALEAKAVEQDARLASLETWHPVPRP